MSDNTKDQHGYDNRRSSSGGGVVHRPAAAGPRSSASSSSYDAFHAVDAMVSKPVMGSDGASSWQDFQRNSAQHQKLQRLKIAKNDALASKSGVPLPPLKHADRQTTTTTTTSATSTKNGNASSAGWQEERESEERTRKESGHAPMGSGYTTFKGKSHAERQEEQRRQKEIKRIEQRIRPDDVEYFIPSKTFRGWKKDYVFTTRRESYGTGYYWDGMDSIKILRGETLPGTADGGDHDATANKKDGQQEGAGEKTTATTKKKKKRKRPEQQQAPVIVNDPNNPMEQVAAALQRRMQQQQQQPPPGLLSVGMSSRPIAMEEKYDLHGGWERATDPSSGKAYYYHRATGQRQWDEPFAFSTGTECGEASVDGKSNSAPATTSNEGSASTRTTNGNNTENSSSNSNNVDSTNPKSQQHRQQEKDNEEQETELPSGWNSTKDPSTGKLYYYNAVTGETKWEKPQ